MIQKPNAKISGGNVQFSGLKEGHFQSRGKKYAESLLQCDGIFPLRIYTKKNKDSIKRSAHKLRNIYSSAFDAKSETFDPVTGFYNMIMRLCTQ
jgi:hypothetical protein